MTNVQYEKRYGRALGVARRFNPTPTLSSVQADAILVAVAWRTFCPRLPRLGERVLMMKHDGALTEDRVKLEGHTGGVQVSFVTDSGVELHRGEYRRLWDFPRGGPEPTLV